DIPRAPRLLRPTAEAVEHHARWRSGRREDRERIVPRVARVDHKRLADTPRHLDLLREYLALLLSRRVVVVIIEPCLAHPDHALLGRCKLLEVGDQLIALILGIVRMQSDRRPYLPMRSSSPHRPLTARAIDANRHSALDTGRAHALQHIVEVLDHVEMAVRVDEHAALYVDAREQGLALRHLRAGHEPAPSPGGRQALRIQGLGDTQ